MEDSKKIKVINRKGNGIVGYTIPDMGNLRREFQDGEEKIVTYEEIRKLSYIPGGEILLKEYLTINDKDVLKELNYQPEQEYFYTKDDIINLMTKGSLDEFLDCLDFAPEGVLESIKQLAVELPLNDVAKRDAILDKMGFDVTKAIEIKKLSEEPSESTVKAVNERRAAVPEENGSSSENVSTSRRVIKK